MFTVSWVDGGLELQSNIWFSMALSSYNNFQSSNARLDGLIELLFRQMSETVTIDYKSC